MFVLSCSGKLEHALELTEYIDINAFGDDEIGDENGGNEKPPMSMGELERELAKLMSNSGSQPGITLSNGKAFSDPVELGEHMALMEGLVGEEDDHLLRENGVKTAAFSTPHFLGDNTNADDNAINDNDFEEYDDYDMDACQEAAEYDFQEFLTQPKEDRTVEETNTEKWDGEGLFQADVDQEVKLTANQEKYLKCYQTMYDDEVVNTELLLEVLHYIIKNSQGEGAILVFLPGWYEISEVSMLLENTTPFNNRSKFMVLPLHSGIPSQDQRRVLRRPPVGTRKIVLRCVFDWIELES